MKTAKRISTKFTKIFFQVFTVGAWIMLLISIPLVYYGIGIPFLIMSIISLILLKFGKKKLIDEGGMAKFADTMANIEAEAYDRHNMRASSNDVASQIEKLHKLKEDGVLTEDEFNKKKKILLSA